MSARDAANGAVIEAEIGWFGRLLDHRFRVHAGEAEGKALRHCPPPRLPRRKLPYAEGVRAARLSPAERLVLILAILPHLRPQALDSLLIHNRSSERRFTEFGGTNAGEHSGFRPTRETALFLLAGESMKDRLAAMRLFAPDRPLQALHILEPNDESGEAGPWLPLIVSQRWIRRLTGGEEIAPGFGSGFPAQPLETAYRWDDLVLGETVRDELESILAWCRNERRLMAELDLARHVKPGYRALFHGPPGTGKTVTAAVLGNTLRLPVYRVDLSRVVSKWIGETEKNLASLFDRASEGGMLLFFDEADALFGKRGDTRSANDRHANQQIAYLLQRIEDCPGVVILASNLKSNIDAAFARRFQAIVYFPMPDADARLKLWRAAFAPPRDRLVEQGDLALLARRHELTGGEIVNVLRYVSVRALRDRRRGPLALTVVEAAIRRELINAGRMVG
jgi:hypothetical protein